MYATLAQWMRTIISKADVKAAGGVMVDVVDPMCRAVNGLARGVAVTEIVAVSPTRVEVEVSPIEVTALLVGAEYFREWKGAALECLEGMPARLQQLGRSCCRCRPG